ncbi:hypothetical protein DFH09DRAFT_1087654 [Mycena vulgaris]|nr:hypothetical protein DFH09DRAFT_1087654 [Mycena vulgaris]
MMDNYSIDPGNRGVSSCLLPVGVIKRRQEHVATRFGNNHIDSTTAMNNKGREAHGLRSIRGSAMWIKCIFCAAPQNNYSRLSDGPTNDESSSGLFVETLMAKIGITNPNPEKLACLAIPLQIVQSVNGIQCGGHMMTSITDPHTFNRAGTLAGGNWAAYLFNDSLPRPPGRWSSDDLSVRALGYRALRLLGGELPSSYDLDGRIVKRESRSHFPLWQFENLCRSRTLNLEVRCGAQSHDDARLDYLVFVQGCVWDETAVHLATMSTRRVQYVSVGV